MESCDPNRQFMFCSVLEFDTGKKHKDVAVVLYTTRGHDLLINNDA